MLLTKEVEITLGSMSINISYFKKIGYDIPTYKNKYGKFTVKPNTKILVKVEDLMPTSKVRVECECDNCGLIYTVGYGNYNLHNRDGKTYCKKCIAQLFNSGENCNLYNPNLTDEERIIGRNYKEYYDFIKLVLKRDKYKCKVCNKDNCKLEVHHLDGYEWCKEKRTDVSNGITLCKNCHKNFHYLYGNKGNTKEQFEEWYGKRVLSDSNIDENLSTCKKIIRLEDRFIIDNPTSYCRINKIKIVNLYQACNGLRKSYNGNHYMWYEEYIKLSDEEIQHKLYDGHYKKVVCIEENKVFLTIRNAVKYFKSLGLNVNPSIISAVCKHKRNKHYGYSWCYMEEYNGDIDKLEKAGDGW